MTFQEHYENQAFINNAYIFDCRYDYIGSLLKGTPIAKHSMMPIYRSDNYTYMNARTAYLLLILHKLNVRPSL